MTPIVHTALHDATDNAWATRSAGPRPVHMSVGQARARAGLTLVELVVTMAVTVALLALAVPGLAAMRAASRGAECSSNLRQMGMAAILYSSHYRDGMPAAVIFKLGPQGMSTISWDTEQRPDGSMRPGPIWSYTDSPGDILQCPDFQGPSTFGADPFSGYNYNTTYIGAEGRFPELGPDGQWKHGWNNARLGLPPTQHRRPSECALFGDAGWKGGANKFMRAPSAEVEQDLGTVYAGGQAFRHRGCAHVVYLDGHVRPSERCCEGVHATPELLESVMGAPDNGFLSDDDSAYDPR
jgi:prepilin-type processing-associated H-X9-DG protein